MKILVTCPPMIRQISRFTDHFAAQGATVHCPEFEQVLAEETLIELVPQFDGWIIGDDPATAAVFAAGKAGKLRAAMKWGAGVDNVDFGGAAAAGIPVTNTPGTFGEEVSDVAIGYVVGLARGLFQIDRGVRAGMWPKPAGMTLAGKKVGLVGYGFIGRCVARKLVAMGLSVTAYDPFAPDDHATGVERATWPDRVGEADFLVFACALSPDNRHMLDAEVLEQAKDGVYLVNVGRGPLIDEVALVAALESGKVRGAALEVMECEPLPDDSPLRQFDQCVFGSHNSSNTVEAVIRTSEVAIKQLFAYLGEAK